MSFAQVTDQYQVPIVLRSLQELQHAFYTPPQLTVYMALKNLLRSYPTFLLWQTQWRTCSTTSPPSKLSTVLSLNFLNKSTGDMVYQNDGFETGSNRCGRISTIARETLRKSTQTG